MVMYIPEPTPNNLDEIPAYLQRELNRIAEYFANLEPSQLQMFVQQNTLPRPRQGLIAYSEAGNLGTDEGLYRYDGSDWIYIGIPTTVKEIVIEAYSTPLGSSSPTQALRSIGASGSVSVPVLRFSSVTSQECLFEFHAPKDILTNTACNFHLMWIPGASYTTGNYVWKLEYLVKADDADLSTGTPTTISADVTPSDAVSGIETEFSSTITMGPEDVLIGRLYRDTASDNGDDVGDLRFAEINYQTNIVGEAV